MFAMTSSDNYNALRKVCREAMNMKTEPDPSEQLFEDDPRAAKELEYGDRHMTKLIDNRPEWEIERDEADAIREAAMKSLTVDQMEAIKETHKTLGDALNMLSEINDLYLSDIRKLDDVFWKIKNEFNLGDR